MDERDENRSDNAHDTAGNSTRDSTSDSTRAEESTGDIMADNMRRNLDSGEAGLAVGEGLGGIGGLAAGAVIGSLAGPVGTVIGAIAGAVGGWWAGREVAEAAEDYSQEADMHYRDRFEADESRGRFASYDHARPLYQLGYVASQNPDYAGRSFDDVEPDIRRGWSQDLERQYGSWNDVRGTVSQAYDSGGRPRRTQ